MAQIKGCTKSQFGTSKANEAPNHFSGVQMDEKYVRVKET
jgi:hypothetical protein